MKKWFEIELQKRKGSSEQNCRDEKMIWNRIAETEKQFGKELQS